MPYSLTTVLASWADLYGGSVPVSIAVTSLHLGGMLLGGGLAISADRTTLRALRHPGAPVREVTELASVHRPVLVGLSITVLTGALMVAADLDTLARSPVFWVKMAVIGGLAANGWRLRQAADSIRQRGAADAGARKRLARGARTSLVLWFTALVLGATLPAA